FSSSFRKNFLCDPVLSGRFFSIISGPVLRYVHQPAPSERPAPAAIVNRMLAAIFCRSTTISIFFSNGSLASWRRRFFSKMYSANLARSFFIAVFLNLF
ncbi:MAG: hypothetical protein QME28_05325, partial [Candidatus Saccharicenans sp.]|nr:hypothetical protein [Candidatus Saccharicenans sp.]